MRRDATMHRATASEVVTLVAAMLAAVAFGLPVIDPTQTASWPVHWPWHPPQRNAWNPYDCCFWQTLPRDEFAL